MLNMQELEVILMKAKNKTDMKFEVFWTGTTKDIKHGYIVKLPEKVGHKRQIFILLRRDV